MEELQLRVEALERCIAKLHADNIENGAILRQILEKLRTVPVAPSPPMPVPIYFPPPVGPTRLTRIPPFDYNS